MQLFSQRRTAVQSSKEMRHFLKRTSSYFQWDLQVCKVIKECSFLWKEHKVIFNETYTCAKLWRSAAFFERDIELFSIRLRAVQKRYTIDFRKDDSITSEWNPSSNHFKRLICGIPQRMFWCKYVQNFLHTRVNHLIEKHAIIQRNITMK